MTTKIQAQDAAAALLDGGWKPEDKEDLMAEYSLTEDEADEIIQAMKELKR